MIVDDDYSDIEGYDANEAKYDGYFHYCFYIFIIIPFKYKM